MATLTILPSGHLHIITHAANSDTLPKTLLSALQAGLGNTLFQLACLAPTRELSPTFRYWQLFAQHYMNYRCHLEPDLGEQAAVTALANTDFTMLAAFDELLIAPPAMRGAEYISGETLRDAWCRLDTHLCQQVNDAQQSLSGFLKQRASQWHQVGRVCLHLAENKGDNEYPFAFMATYVSELTRRGSPKYRPLGEALQQLSNQKNKPELIRLLSPLDLASQHSDLIRDLLASGDIYHPLAWSAAEAHQFLQQTSQFEKAGLALRLPDWWKKPVRARVSVSIGKRAKNTLDVDALLDVDIGVTLGDTQLTEAEWQHLMAAEDALIFFKGQWVELNKEKLQHALDHWQSVQHAVAYEGLSFAEAMRLLAGATPDLKPDDSPQFDPDWSAIQAGAGLNALLEKLRQPTSSKATRPGKALQATLRPYQQQGVEWLWTLSQLKLGACLADDMGLGKTIQIIALLLLLKKKHVNNNRPSLLVLPASLLGNWQAEIEKFAPSLRYLLIHPSQQRTQPREEDCANCDLILTTYGMLTRQTWLLQMHWQLAILDEAQAIKNAATKQTKAVKQLRAESRIALTGTPVENRPSDLWSLFDFICPGLLGSAKRFQLFTRSLVSRETDTYGPLRKLVQPYILRRLKTDKSIISDLPDKTEVNTYYHLTKKQAAHYKKAVSALHQALDDAEGIQRKGLVLAFLMRFKQICNHPSQWLGNDDYAPNDSGKFLRLASLCEEIASRQQKVLIFTQFREITAPLSDFLSQCFGHPGLSLHGGTPVKRRKQYVDAFQQEGGPQFFVLSIKAGGTGLNLTQASHVIHFDRWWNPAVENQATDRAFRIGQKRNVMVHKMVCRGTIEEKIDLLIAEKQALAKDLINPHTETLLTEMSTDRLIDLVSLDINQVDM